MTITNAGTMNTPGAANAQVEEYYRRALEIDEKLAAQSSDPQRLRALATDELYIGRHFSDTGHWKEAIASEQKAIATNQKYATDPNNMAAQRDVAAFINNLGDTYLMSGDEAQALASYERALKLLTAISSADPQDNDARASTAEGYLNVGNALRRMGKPADALRYLQTGTTMQEAAAERDATDVYIARDISTGYLWMASVLSAKHNSDGALKDYTKAIAIQERFARLDPKNLDTQVALAGMLAAFADFLRTSRQMETASDDYRQSITIGESLLSNYPDKAEMRYILVQSYLGMGQIYSARASTSSSSVAERIGNWTQAKSWLQRSSDLLRQIPHPAAVTPTGFDTVDAAQIAQAMSTCDAAQARLAAH
jgi:tetratricopeptide (TPR) repeat protein